MYVKNCLGEDITPHLAVINLFREAIEDSQRYSHVNLSHMALEDADMIPLIKTISTDKYVVSIDLSYNRIQQVTSIFDVINDANEITSIDLRGNALNPRHVTQLRSFASSCGKTNFEIHFDSDENSIESKSFTTGTISPVLIPARLSRVASADAHHRKDITSFPIPHVPFELQSSTNSSKCHSSRRIRDTEEHNSHSNSSRMLSLRDQALEKISKAKESNSKQKSNLMSLITPHANSNVSSTVSSNGKKIKQSQSLQFASLPSSSSQSQQPQSVSVSMLVSAAAASGAYHAISNVQASQEKHESGSYNINKQPQRVQSPLGMVPLLDLQRMSSRNGSMTSMQLYYSSKKQEGVSTAPISSAHDEKSVSPVSGSSSEHLIPITRATGRMASSKSKTIGKHGVNRIRVSANGTQSQQQQKTTVVPPVSSPNTRSCSGSRSASREQFQSIQQEENSYSSRSTLLQQSHSQSVNVAAAAAATLSASTNRWKRSNSSVIVQQQDLVMSRMNWLFEIKRIVASLSKLQKPNNPNGYLSQINTEVDTAPLARIISALESGDYRQPGMLIERNQYEENSTEIGLGLSEILVQLRKVNRISLSIDEIFDILGSAYAQQTSTSLLSPHFPHRSSSSLSTSRPQQQQQQLEINRASMREQDSHKGNNPKQCKSTERKAKIEELVRGVMKKPKKQSQSLSTSAITASSNLTKEEISIIPSPLSALNQFKEQIREAQKRCIKSASVSYSQQQNSASLIVSPPPVNSKNSSSSNPISQDSKQTPISSIQISPVLSARLLPTGTAAQLLQQQSHVSALPPKSASKQHLSRSKQPRDDYSKQGKLISRFPKKENNDSLQNLSSIPLPKALNNSRAKKSPSLRTKLQEESGQNYTHVQSPDAKEQQSTALFKKSLPWNQSQTCAQQIQQLPGRAHGSIEKPQRHCTIEDLDIETARFSREESLASLPRVLKQNRSAHDLTSNAEIHSHSKQTSPSQLTSSEVASVAGIPPCFAKGFISKKNIKCGAPLPPQVPLSLSPKPSPQQQKHQNNQNKHAFNQVTTSIPVFHDPSVVVVNTTITPQNAMLRIGAGSIPVPLPNGINRTAFTPKTTTMQMTPSMSGQLSLPVQTLSLKQQLQLMGLVCNNNSSSPFASQGDMSAIQLSETCLKNVTLTEIATDIMALGGEAYNDENLPPGVVSSVVQNSNMVNSTAHSPLPMHVRCSSSSSQYYSAKIPIAPASQVLPHFHTPTHSKNSITKSTNSDIQIKKNHISMKEAVEAVEDIQQLDLNSKLECNMMSQRVSFNNQECFKDAFALLPQKQEVREGEEISANKKPKRNEQRKEKNKETSSSCENQNGHGSSIISTVQISKEQEQVIVQSNAPNEETAVFSFNESAGKFLGQSSIVSSSEVVGVAETSEGNALRRILASDFYYYNYNLQDASRNQLHLHESSSGYANNSSVMMMEFMSNPNLSNTNILAQLVGDENRRQAVLFGAASAATVTAAGTGTNTGAIVGISNISSGLVSSIEKASENQYNSVSSIITSNSAATSAAAAANDLWAQMANYIDFEEPAVAPTNQSKQYYPRISHQSMSRMLRAIRLTKISDNEMHRRVLDSNAMRRFFHDAQALKITVSHALDDVPHFRDADLSKNYLHANLRIINLSCNGIKSLKYLLGMKDLHQVTFLNVSHNKLESLEGIEGLTSLRELHVAHNRIACVREDTISKLFELKQVDLQNNAIDCIEAVTAFVVTKNLHLLYISKNPIAKLPHYFAALQKVLVNVKLVDIADTQLFVFTMSEFSKYGEICFSNENEIREYSDIKNTSSDINSSILKQSVNAQQSLSLQLGSSSMQLSSLIQQQAAPSILPYSSDLKRQTTFKQPGYLQKLQQQQLQQSSSEPIQEEPLLESVNTQMTTSTSQPALLLQQQQHQHQQQQQSQHQQQSAQSNMQGQLSGRGGVELSARNTCSSSRKRVASSGIFESDRSSSRTASETSSQTQLQMPAQQQPNIISDRSVAQKQLLEQLIQQQKSQVKIRSNGSLFSNDQSSLEKNSVPLSCQLSQLRERKQEHKFPHSQPNIYSVYKKSEVPVEQQNQQQHLLQKQLFQYQSSDQSYAAVSSLVSHLKKKSNLLHRAHHGQAEVPREQQKQGFDDQKGQNDENIDTSNFISQNGIIPNNNNNNNKNSAEYSSKAIPPKHNHSMGDFFSSLVKKATQNQQILNPQSSSFARRTMIPAAHAPFGTETRQ